MLFILTIQTGLLLSVGMLRTKYLVMDVYLVLETVQKFLKIKQQMNNISEEIK